MSKIKVTKQNLPNVYGMLKKFFYNKNKTGFLMWHNFDCGNKRKISSLVKMHDGSLVDVKTEQPAPQAVELEDTYIRIVYFRGVEGEVIKIGDEIKFKSGKIEFKKKWFDNRMIYSVIQAKKLSNDSTRDYYERMNIWLDYENDYDLDFA